MINSDLVEPFLSALKEGKSLAIEGQNASAKALIITHAIKELKRPCLLITQPLHSQNLLGALDYFNSEKVLELPAWETLPSENIPPSPDIVGERFESLIKLNDTSILVGSLQSVCQKVVPKEVIEMLTVDVSQGMRLNILELQKQLISSGYQRRKTVTDKGEYAIRGSILDVFALSYSKPVRIEFYDEQVETLRFFDTNAQKSVEKVSHVIILPADELALLKLDASMAEKAFTKEPLIIFDDLSELENIWVDLKSLQGTKNAELQRIKSVFKDLKSCQSIFFSKEPLKDLSDLKVNESPKKSKSGLSIPYSVGFSIFGEFYDASLWISPFISLGKYFQESFLTENGKGDLLSLLEDGGLSKENTTFYYHSEKEKKRLEKALVERNFDLSLLKIEEGSLIEGLVAISDPSICLFPFSEIKGSHALPRKQMRSSVHSEPSDVWTFKPGDLVVHIQHGVGKFMGLKTHDNHNSISTEFIEVEYADRGRLFVPLSQSYLITKYIGSEDSSKNPVLHTLGSGRWKKVREQTLKSIQKYAKDLLTMYAKRELSKGEPYPEDGIDMLEFEEEFPYQETDDQITAIEAIKKDLESTQPMDRLICGDVGYGKTEVAMRGAFKSVIDGGKQVAILVPTTILALQHAETLVERMKNYPIRVDYISRFRTAKERKAVIEDCANGEVDILIGTHRIVSKDVKFKKLGLVVVDEEHRFGVAIKEKLKGLKVDLNYLALSATPIPRTLYLSLMGSRDISIINTPPQDRLPIKTIITEYDDETIKQAIYREILRRGQVYFIHNRVESIYSVAKKIEDLVPQAKVLVVHGQMSSEDIDRAFHSFKSGEGDVLVATTIIESGVDIPNANTLIIDRADCFGLADLYQLRGRVGRWNRRAFAYFFVPKQSVISQDARKRLDALVEAGGFGGGMKIAMRDLEIRGAGDILGIEQSGHVSHVGFHLYCKMLKRTVQALHGDYFENFVDTKVEMALDAKIPEWYVDESSLRMELYQRIGEAVSIKDLAEIFDEMKDRYGKIPNEVEMLHFVSRVRVHAGHCGVTLLKIDQLKLHLEYLKDKKTDRKTYFLKASPRFEDYEKAILESLEKFKKGL